MTRRVIAGLALLTLLSGCGEAGEVEWSDWQSYPDEDSTGEMVQDGQDYWVHHPTYYADTPRQFRYKTSRSVDAFVAPEDQCQASNAYNRWSNVTEFDVADYGHQVSGNSGEPVCVRIDTELINDNAMWHVEPLFREQS